MTIVPRPDLVQRPCMSSDHEPPNLIYIPPGQAMEHTCSGCGRKTILRGSASYC
jgi:hypothetical protein